MTRQQIDVAVVSTVISITCGAVAVTVGAIRGDAALVAIGAGLLGGPGLAQGAGRE